MLMKKYSHFSLKISEEDVQKKNQARYDRAQLSLIRLPLFGSHHRRLEK